MSLSDIVDIVSHADEATPENIAARELSGKVRQVAMVVGSIAAAVLSYHATRSVLRRRAR